MCKTHVSSGMNGVLYRPGGLFQQTCPEIRFAAAEYVTSEEYGGSIRHEVIQDCLEIAAPMARCFVFMRMWIGPFCGKGRLFIPVVTELFKFVCGTVHVISKHFVCVRVNCVRV